MTERLSHTYGFSEDKPGTIDPVSAISFSLDCMSLAVLVKGTKVGEVIRHLISPSTFGQFYIDNVRGCE